jgi:zinc D-Ala-D-Ala dipeptidase
MSLFGPLEELRQTPIPDQAPARSARIGFRAHPIDTGNPHYPEPLVDSRLRKIAGENYYHATHNPPYWRRIEGAIGELLLRRSVSGRLAAVNRQLGEVGLELFLFDAWRPRAVQAYFHDVWMPRELRKRDSSLQGAALVQAVERYWSAPSLDETSPAPHATGAAVDLTLRWVGGDKLWMGSIFDDVTPLAHRDRFEVEAGGELAFSDEEARANRRLLHWVMAEQGFAGHPDEWWHFSWGDQLWARLSGEPAGFYGLAAGPEGHG